MTRCPSYDWDAQTRSQELPEACPCCGKPNADDQTGDWICEVAPGFCSLECQDAWVAEQRAIDEAEAQAIADAETSAADYWRDA